MFLNKNNSLKLLVIVVFDCYTISVMIIFSGTHKTVEDLLPSSTYYRFNPFLSQDIQLDEVRDEQWDQMYQDTKIYCNYNKPKLEKATCRLTQPKKTQQKIKDWIKFKRLT